VYIETGYILPTKGSFRKNYDRVLFVGSVKSVPLTIGLGAEFPLLDDVRGYCEFWRASHELSSSDQFTLSVIPGILGCRYYVPRDMIDLGEGNHVFVNLGFGVYWARFSATYYLVSAAGTTYGIADDVKNYFGYGALGGCGVDLALAGPTSLALFINYDITSLGSIRKGGLGNLGGFFAGIRLVFSLS